MRFVKSLVVWCLVVLLVIQKRKSSCQQVSSDPDVPPGSRVDECVFHQSFTNELLINDAILANEQYPFDLNLYSDEIPRFVDHMLHTSVPLVAPVKHHSVIMYKNKYQMDGRLSIKIKHNFARYSQFLRHTLIKGFPKPILPFSWDDWKDFSVLNKRLKHIEKNVDSAKIRENQEILKGANYLYFTGQPVNQIVICTNTSTNIEFKAVSINSKQSGVFEPKVGILHKIEAEIDRLLHMNSYSQKNVRGRHIDYISEFEELLKMPYASLIQLPKYETRFNRNYYSGSKPSENELPYSINLHSYDFKFSLPERIEELKQPISHTEPYSHHVNNRLLNYYQNTHNNLIAIGKNKFFKEVQFDGDRLSKINRLASHYDWRFFNGILDNNEKYIRLHHMVRTFQNFANNAKIIYWLSHGNLLSWRWSGTNFFWDHDIDIQLPIKHLEYIAVNYNSSFIIENPNDGIGRYYLEINPLFAQIERGQGLNIIDGRFIDIDTGLYIDLTGVSYRNYEGYYLLGDKNNHYYNDIEELSPVRQTLFEGATSFVPHEVDKILIQEYPQGLTKQTYTDYSYTDKLHGWMKNSEKCLNTGNSQNHYCDMFSSDHFKKIMRMWYNHKMEDKYICASTSHPGNEYCSKIPNGEYISNVKGTFNNVKTFIADLSLSLKTLLYQTENLSDTVEKVNTEQNLSLKHTHANLIAKKIKELTVKALEFEP